MEGPEIIKGNPPSGYSFVTMDEKPMKAMLWYANAVKVARVTGRPLKPYVITYKNGVYTLWVQKRKGEGKMVGAGFDPKKMQRAEQRKQK
jgi:hypothetical protein